jgi:hypothetical protein
MIQICKTAEPEALARLACSIKLFFHILRTGGRQGRIIDSKENKWNQKRLKEEKVMDIEYKFLMGH